MTKGKKVSLEHPTLPFDPPKYNLSKQVRESLRKTIRKRGLSMEDLALFLSQQLDEDVSHHTLYNMCAESHAHRFPLEWAAAWCRVTGSNDLVRVLCEGLGLPMPEAGHLDKVRFAEARIEADLAQREATGLAARILRRGDQ